MGTNNLIIDGIKETFIMEHITSNVLTSPDLKKMKDVFSTQQYLPMLESQMSANEREEIPSFEGFTDLSMIYYFIHKKRHQDDDKNKTIESRQEYTRDLLQFYKYLNLSKEFLIDDVQNFRHDSLLKNLRGRHIKAFQDWLAQEAPLSNGKKGYALATRAKKVSIIKAFCKWLYDVQYITLPLHLDFRSHSVSLRDRPKREFSYEEVKALLDYYHDHPINLAILSIFATTGARVREIAQAKMSDLYYDSSMGRYYLKLQTKGNKEREAVIFHNVFERIMQFRKRRRISAEINPDDHSPLLVTNKYKPYSYTYLSEYITRIVANTKLPFLKYKAHNITPHTFRHFFARYSLEQGVDIVYIQKTLGHASIRTTEIYLNELLKKKHDAALQWDEKQF